MKKEETFSDYNLTAALEFLNLPPPLKWEMEITGIPPSEFLMVGLKRAERQITVGSNEWEQRLFMEILFLEALEKHKIRMWQEKIIDAGTPPFRGKADFVFTPYQVSFRTPYLILSEAKKENFEDGWGQCLMGMKACQILNKNDGHSFDMHGIVSTGTIWEFGKLSDGEFRRTSPYTISQLDTLLGILDFLFSRCGKP